MKNQILFNYMIASILLIFFIGGMIYLYQNSLTEMKNSLNDRNNLYKQLVEVNRKFDIIHNYTYIEIVYPDYVLQESSNN